MNRLAFEGAEPAFMVATLAAVTVNATKLDPRAGASNLEGAAAVLLTPVPCTPEQAQLDYNGGP